jgi:hypothetical protein
MSQIMYSLHEMPGSSPRAILDAERARIMTFSRRQQTTEPGVALAASR